MITLWCKQKKCGIHWLESRRVLKSIRDYSSLQYLPLITATNSLLRLTQTCSCCFGSSFMVEKDEGCFFFLTGWLLMRFHVIGWTRFQFLSIILRNFHHQHFTPSLQSGPNVYLDPLEDEMHSFAFGVWNDERLFVRNLTVSMRISLETRAADYGENCCQSVLNVCKCQRKPFAIKMENSLNVGLQFEKDSGREPNERRRESAAKVKKIVQSHSISWGIWARTDQKLYEGKEFIHDDCMWLMTRTSLAAGLTGNTKQRRLWSIFPGTPSSQLPCGFGGLENLPRSKGPPVSSHRDVVRVAPCSQAPRLLECRHAEDNRASWDPTRASLIWASTPATSSDQKPA